MIYIALLRGINVGGHNVKMDKLRGLFTNLNLENVRSFIQSGNIFFESEEKDQSLLRQKIQKYLAAELGFNVPVFLRTLEQLKKIMSIDPFAKVKVTDDIRLSIVFLAEPTKVDLPVPFTTPDGGYKLVAKTDTELFVVWHLKNGRPTNSYGLMEKKIGVATTTRFWHTTQKILLATEN